MRTKNKRESIQFETDIRQGRVERTEIIIPAQLGSLLHSLIALAVGGICWIWQYRICKIINIISLFYGHWDYLLWSAGKCIYMFSNLPTAATALHPFSRLRLAKNSSIPLGGAILACLSVAIFCAICLQLADAPAAFFRCRPFAFLSRSLQLLLSALWCAH